MSIAFAVNAGPLTQIGIELASLPTAYQLATGAYGWFKARERSQSLQELMSVSGGQLVSTSSFNLRAYKNIRINYTSMQGVVVQDQRVRRTSLPKGSTAVPENPGIACLRAVTTALLLLYNTEAIVEILQDLIPYGLLQLNQEDNPLEIEGALLTSLGHWVSAVALEEDSDLFRKFMLETVNIRQSRMTGVHLDDVMDMDHVSVNEIPLVIGVLRWILTPPHKRKHQNYPTRSLKVWTAACVMEILGFEIEADSVVVQTIHDYKSNALVLGRFVEKPSVFLVVTNSQETDPTPALRVPRASGSSKPQITMIRGIPWIVFRHLRGSRSEIDTEYLADVWNISFRSAKSCFKGITVQQKNVKIEIKETERAVVPEFHKSLLSKFSPELHRICGTVMRLYVPVSSSSPGWNLIEIEEQMTMLGLEDQPAHTRSHCRDSCYILYAIVYGAIYGLCSNACFDSGSVLGEDSEVVFTPDLLFQEGGGKIKQEARTVGFALQRGEVDLSTWQDLLFELFLGKDTDSHRVTSQHAPSMTDYLKGQNPLDKRLFLGAQSNGMAAVADILVTLTTRMESLCYFHINRGQVLNFPLTEDYYIQGSTYIEPASAIRLDSEPHSSNLHRFDTACSESAMRVDVEPCWVGDPRTVVFSLRSHGVPIATLNICSFIDRIAFESVECSCRKPSWEIPVQIEERWRHVSLHQLTQTRHKGTSFGRVDVNHVEDKILIDGSQSVAASIYAICIVHARHLFIATECLACAYARGMLNSSDFNTLIVMIR
ncbi:MAG: hypothetical protein Q9172_007709 [Xanthocarpia lactea]